jgi:predicted enzyme related to lactoylglutathione lyase
MFEHGQFYWNELITPDVEKAKAFYAKTLGWTFETMPMPEGDYILAKQGDNMAGGIMQTPPDMGGAPAQWYSYIAVDDVDAGADAAVKAGGALMRPLFDVEGVGRIAILKDATGAVICLITPVPMEG